MKSWYKKYGKLLFKAEPKAYALYELYKHENGIYNGEPRLAQELAVSPRTLKRINITLQDFNLISIDNYTGMCKVNNEPKIDVGAVCEKYGITCESPHKIEDIFDANILADIRKRLGNKRIRIEKIGQELGLSKTDIERVKNDKVLNTRYKDALTESLYIMKGTTREDDFRQRLSEWKDNKAWNSLDVLGYFCFKYEQARGVPFLFTNTKDPFRSKEVAIAARLMTIFKCREAVKNYLDWLFDVKNGTRGFEVFGVGSATQNWIINEYNCSKSKKKKITRTTPLPEEYVKWCKENISSLTNDYELETYGNLKTLLGMVEGNYAEEPVIRAVARAREVGIIKEKK